MINVSRRAWLKASALAPVAIACSRPRTSKDVLRALVLDVATEDAKEIVVASARLAEGLGAVVDGSTPAALDAARTAWKTALLSWQRATCFQTPALLKSNALLRAIFFPVRAPAVEHLALSGMASSDGSVSELGVDRKGMFALEVLLFGVPGTAATPLFERAGPEGQQARRFAQLLGANVAQYARAAASELGDGKATAESYAQGGQETLSRLVSQMVGTIGSLTSGRLSKALATDGASKPSQIEGYSSGSALDILETLVHGVERVYAGGRGGGLAELVHARSAALDASLRARFREARSALEQANRARGNVRSHELGAAQAAVRALDHALESEFTSALGVTLTFAGPDAD
ncbi:MAG TPA: imelysin family protein [Polyangiaceae bacterium]